jgi:antirestriction protein ArdC
VFEQLTTATLAQIACFTGTNLVDGLAQVSDDVESIEDVQAMSGALADHGEQRKNHSPAIDQLALCFPHALNSESPTDLAEEASITTSAGSIRH